MMKNIILFLGIIFPTYCFSQVNVSFSAGLAGFNMQDMKKHQSELQMEFPVDIKTIESFPSFWSYEFAITGEVRKWFRLGGMIGYTSTGGRMHYRDYSGEIEINQVTTAPMIAIQGEVLLTREDEFPIYFYLKSGAAFGRYDLDIFFKLNNEQDSEHLEFGATNLFIEPGLLISKRIAGIFSANLTGGYNMNVFQDKLRLKDDKDLFLLDSSGNEVNLDWSGFRVGVGVSMAF